jgi:hypothetical protein
MPVAEAAIMHLIQQPAFYFAYNKVLTKEKFVKLTVMFTVHFIGILDNL